MSGRDEVPSVQEILALHEEVERAYSFEHTGTRAFFPEEKLGRIVERARGRDGVFERAAVLLRGLPRIHAFEDGNKRTAWMAAYECLDRSGVEPEPSSDAVALVMHRIGRFDRSELARWLQTGEIDDDRLRYIYGRFGP